MARDSRLRVGGWVPDGDTADGDTWRSPVGGAYPPVTPDGGTYPSGPPEGDTVVTRADGAGALPEDGAHRTDDMDDPDATMPVPGLIDLGDDPGWGPTADPQTGEMSRYRGWRRHRRREPRGHLLAAAAVVAAVVIGTASLVRLASSDPVTLGPPPAPESSEVLTSPSAVEGRLGEAPTPTPGASSSPGAGGPSSSPGPDPTAPGSTAPPPDPGSGGSYEAEHASAQRGAATESMGAASGGQVVRLNPNASLQFSGVVADREGTYQLTVYYAGTSHRTARLSVNGGSSATVEFPALGAGTVGTVTLGVHLAEGENMITISQPNEPGLLEDRILVTD